MLKVIHKDITEIDRGFIFQQVNCQRAYGKGLSGAISKKWPVVEERYRKVFSDIKDIEQLGNVDIIDVEDDVSVCNIYGQLYYGGSQRQTDYCAVGVALSFFTEIVGTFHVNDTRRNWPKYFPFLFGAGLANGDPATIHRIIEHHIPDAILVKK